MSSPDAFFAFARERHAVHLRRRAGHPWPWTQDPILQQYRFTCVFRELDVTTEWFRSVVREPMRSSPDVLLATVLFRWFNRVTTGEAIFQQETLGLGGEEPGETAWQALVRTGDVSVLRAAALQYCGDGPYVTGAYIIKTPDGMSKLDGVLQCVEWFMDQEHQIDAGKDMVYAGWQQVAETCLEHPGDVTLQDVWSWLRQFPYLGDFMAYEIVTDLRHTDLLCRAPDIMTWANPGPGAARGLSRIFHQDPTHWSQHRDKQRLIALMQDLLDLSQNLSNWPQTHDGKLFFHSRYHDRLMRREYPEHWPAWEMRDVEHTLCEFDKYERARLGEGRPRGTYRRQA